MIRLPLLSAFCHYRQCDECRLSLSASPPRQRCVLPLHPCSRTAVGFYSFICSRPPIRHLRRAAPSLPLCPPPVTPGATRSRPGDAGGLPGCRHSSSARELTGGRDPLSVVRLHAFKSQTRVPKVKGSRVAGDARDGRLCCLVVVTSTCSLLRGNAGHAPL